MFWESLKKSDIYATFRAEFIGATGGPWVGNAFRLMLCGTTDDSTEEQARKDKAWQMIQNLKCCRMSAFEEHAEVFIGLMLAYGEIGTIIETLRMCFSKLPTPWNDVCAGEYTCATSPDTIGKRIKFVEAKLDKFYQEDRLKKEAKEAYRALCAKREVPSLEIGCRNSSDRPRRKRGYLNKMRPPQTHKRNIARRWKKKKGRGFRLRRWNL